MKKLDANQIIDQAEATAKAWRDLDVDADGTAYITAVLKTEICRIAGEYNALADQYEGLKRNFEALLAKYEAVTNELEAETKSTDRGTVVPIRGKNNGGQNGEPLPPAS